MDEANGMVAADILGIPRDDEVMYDVGRVMRRIVEYKRTRRKCCRTSATPL